MYKLTKHSSITRLADNASIPADPANRDYAEYIAWLADGNTPEPAQTAAEIAKDLADVAKAQAQARIAEIRLELIDHLVDSLVGAAAEKAQATAALSMLRVKLANEKAKR